MDSKIHSASLDFLGVSDPGVRDFDWAQFVHPDDRKAYVTGYLDAVTECRLFDATFRLLRYDGEYRWMKSVGAPRFTDDGTLRYYLGSAVDMTDIHQSGDHASLPIEQVDMENSSKEVAGEPRTSHAQLDNVLLPFFTD